jgi:hypothetical protein
MWEIILQGHIMSTSGDALRCVEQILSLSCDWILANSKPYTPNGSDQLRRTKVACILLALLVNWVSLVRVLTSGLTVWMQVLCCISHSPRYTTIVLLMYQSWYGFVLVEMSCLTGVKIRLDDYIFFEKMLPSSTTSASWQVLWFLVSLWLTSL